LGNGHSVMVMIPELVDLDANLDAPIPERFNELADALRADHDEEQSRLIEPLIRLKRYDEKRQAKMRAALEQLKGLENLSGDLYEKIAKALA
jgi:aminopeptidase N